METAAIPDKRNVGAVRRATNLSQTASPLAWPDNHGAVLDLNPFPGSVKNRLLRARTKTSSPLRPRRHRRAPVQLRPRWLGQY